MGVVWKEVACNIIVAIYPNSSRQRKIQKDMGKSTYKQKDRRAQEIREQCIQTQKAKYRLVVNK